MFRPMSIIAPTLTLLLVLMGIFLRFYHLDQSMYFMNDQGLLLLVAHEILTNHHVPIAGPLISLVGQIPPFNYYLVAFFSVLGSDPQLVAVGYIAMNVFAGLVLFAYGNLVFDVATGIIALSATMISASLIESGRSIWEPHPVFFCVALYLLLTEIAFRRKNIALYCVGILIYALSVGLYPTPLLLIIYVVVRTATQLREFSGAFRRASLARAALLIFGIFICVFAPWAVLHNSFPSTTATSVLHILISPARGAHAASSLYDYISTVLHDVFRIWEAIPAALIASMQAKMVALTFFGVGGLLLGKKNILFGIEACIQKNYHWIFVGYFMPAVFGMYMMPHRFFALYPFVLLLLSAAVRHMIVDKSLGTRLVAITIAAIFLVGNLFSWYRSTITNPRNDYPIARQSVQIIMRDMALRNADTSNIGVHYYRRDDQYDFFASFTYYLLRISIRYPVSFISAGNELIRGRPESHDIVYLICDQFIENDYIKGCIDPFRSRWNYRVEQLYPVAKFTSVIVMTRQKAGL